MVTIRQSNGSRLSRSDKTALDPDLVQAAKESLVNGTAQEAVFTTEKEAKANAAKLRSHVNENGNGLNAKVVQEGDEWILEFKVNSNKRATKVTE